MLVWKEYPNVVPSKYGHYLCRTITPKGNGKYRVSYEVKFFCGDKYWCDCDDAIVTHYAEFNMVGDDD